MNQKTEVVDTSTVSDTPDKDARTWAMVCHLIAFSGYIIPFGNLLGPLVVWVIKKDEHPFIDDQGKEAVNFQLTMTIAYITSIILIFVLIGFLLLAILCIYSIVMVIIASIKSYEGESYRYPLTIRFFN